MYSGFISVEEAKELLGDMLLQDLFKKLTEALSEDDDDNIVSAAATGNKDKVEKILSKNKKLVSLKEK